MAESLALKAKVCGCDCGGCGEAGECRGEIEVGERVEVVFGFCALEKVLFRMGEEEEKGKKWGLLSISSTSTL